MLMASLRLAYLSTELLVLLKQLFSKCVLLEAFYQQATVLLAAMVAVAFAQQNCLVSGGRGQKSAFAGGSKDLRKFCEKLKGMAFTLLRMEGAKWQNTNPNSD